MSKKSFSAWLAYLSALLFTTLTANAQELQPQRVSTSTGIYDVQSRDDIHKFSASEIRELVRMENGRPQNIGTHPHPILVYCFEERTFLYTGGKYQNAEIAYRLRTPRNIRFRKKYPLVVHLHGLGDDSLTHAHSILPMLIGPEQRDFFMLVVQAPRTGPEQGWFFRPSTKDGSLDIVMAALEHVVANNPIDSRSITVTGISSGGWGTWEIITRHPDVFAGAVPAASGAPSSGRLTTLKQTPVWAFINKGDGHRFRESIHTATHMLKGAGGSMASTEVVPISTHPWQPAMEDYNALQWMLAQKRGSWFSPLPGVVINNGPHSLLLVFIMYVMPFALIVIFSWNTICQWVPVGYQHVREWCSKL